MMSLQLLEETQILEFSRFFAVERSTSVGALIATSLAALLWLW